ncbi:eCIS core domain-containing protein [Algoriphagus namhaensis]
MKTASGSTAETLQRAPNHTGLPDSLKDGIENLSGEAMDDVQVHRNSPRPAQLNAHAFAQGTNIHVAPGQEQHLPHEAWHVVQQKQGRVKPTLQTEQGTQINDEVSLESEADTMGSRALQLKSPVKATRNSSPSSRVSQLVRDETIRPAVDKRVDSVKKRTTDILEILAELGQDWEKNYGKQGKEKASEKMEGLLKGEKTDYSAEIKKAALKQLWSQLSPEQKLELASEAARLGGEAVSTVFSAGWTAIRELVGSGGSDESSTGRSESSSSGRKEVKKTVPKAKEEDRDEPRRTNSEGSQGSVSFLNNLSMEDINTLYEIYKAKNRALEQIAKAKAKVVDTAGEVGGFVGEQVGKFRDEVDFERRMKSQQKAFQVAQTELRLLKETIAENEDSARYDDEISALEYALESLNGPGLVFKIELNDTARKEFPAKCRLTIDAIKQSGPIVTRDNSLAEIGRSGLRFGASLIRGGEDKKRALDTAKEDLVSSAERAINRSWSKFTSWGWTPDGIKGLKKELKGSDSIDVKFGKLVRIAQEAGAKESGSRHPETQIFYDALANAKPDDELSLKTSAQIIRQIESKLGD